MYEGVLRDPGFYRFLVHADRELAEQTRRSRCRFCGAALHSAQYLRKPRGVPDEIDPGAEFLVCFSFCCSAEGCRKRHRAPSVRFLSRKVYLSAMVVLLTAMQQGPSPRSARRLALFGADRRTLGRWRHWWESVFPRSIFWGRLRGFFPTGVSHWQLPRALLSCLLGSTVGERVLQILRLVSGICRLSDGQPPPAENARCRP